MIAIESRLEMTDRLAITDALRRDADYSRRKAQAKAADAILGVEDVEHVTMWTDGAGRAKHETRIERMS